MNDLRGSPEIEARKADHIRINLEENVQFPVLATGLEQFRLEHRALPELNLSEVSTTTEFLGACLAAPLLVSSMTGGTELARRINLNLAAACQEHNIAMGVGSQRAAIEDPSLAGSLQVRPVAPDILLLANVGAVQLNYGYGPDQCRRAVDMIEANALILHFNALQEAVQPEGDVNFAGLLHKVEKVCLTLGVPVIAKEVGWGFSIQDARDLANAGVAAIDVAGSGGTSWSEVEYHRAPDRFHARVAAAFANWGIPTTQAISNAREGAPDLPVIASGGLRDGIDIARCIALGASLAGLASPFLKAANESQKAVDELIRILIKQLEISMFCTGARDIDVLRNTPLLRVQRET